MAVTQVSVVNENRGACVPLLKSLLQRERKPSVRPMIGQENAPHRSPSTMPYNNAARLSHARMCGKYWMPVPDTRRCIHSLPRSHARPLRDHQAAESLNTVPTPTPNVLAIFRTPTPSARNV